MEVTLKTVSLQSDAAYFDRHVRTFRILCCLHFRGRNTISSDQNFKKLLAISGSPVKSECEFNFRIADLE